MVVEYSAKHWSAKSEKSAVKASESASKAEQYAQAGGLYGKITNCITEIPQDIKLELNNGTLTLKAGSKVYNGDGVFAEITNDISNSTPAVNAQVVVMVANSALYTAYMGESVAELPVNASTYKIFYNTTDKKCYFDTPSGWIPCSFPIALATGTTTNWTSIDQVFNGFGYIGSTVFALPGVKGLIPNGRNADGSLKNIEFTLDSVVMGTATTAASLHNMLLTSDNIYFDDAIYVPNWQFVYKEEENIIINTGSNSTLKGVLFGKCITDSNGVITSFSPKTPFHAVDYQEVEDIVNNLTKHVVVSTLPSSPDADTFYYIPE